MSQDLSPKSSLLSRPAKAGGRAKAETAQPGATMQLPDTTTTASEVFELAPVGSDSERVLSGPCAAALPQAAAPVAIRSPIAVRKTPAGAMHLGPEAARLYTPAEAVGLAREILRRFS